MSNDLIRDTYNALAAIKRGKSIDEARTMMRACRERAEAEGLDWEAVKFRAMAATERAA